MHAITVFCGSSSGSNPVFTEQAYLLGKTLAGRNLTLVYGGAKVGLMGAVADGALKHQGKVIGILTVFLKNVEIGHDHLSELILVDSMHERKAKMNEYSDGIIALPGGFGTLEELFEMLTWAQLGLHKKPVAILNTNGYYNDLLKFIETMVRNGLLKTANQQMLLVSDKIETLLDKMNNYVPPTTDKWSGEKLK